MKILASITLATSLAISLTTAANAAPLPTLTPGSTTTDPLGIDNLVVDGTIYDVTFSTTTLNSFTFGTALSTDADTAITNALNLLSVTGLGGVKPASFYIIDIDNTLTDFDAANCTAACPANGWTGGPDTNFLLGLSGGGSFYTQAADFTAVGTVGGVPEPLTLSLFGAGLLGAAAMRRRKADKAIQTDPTMGR